MFPLVLKSLHNSVIIGMICLRIYSFFGIIYAFISCDVSNTVNFLTDHVQHRWLLKAHQKFSGTFSALIRMMILVYNTSYQQPLNDLYLYGHAHTWPALQVRIRVSSCSCWSPWNSAFIIHMPTLLTSNILKILI